MSVVINTNSAATGAANNLAASNAQLQRSLNRLSSGSKIVNPADDAGGLAVSMKISAAARRQGAVANNLGNATSYLQTQDGVLGTAGKVLSRISELKVLYSDVTKSPSDRANYQTEFAALQSQLTSLGSEKFNGVGLFGTGSLSVGTTEDGTSSVSMQAVNLLGTGAPASWSNVSGVTPGASWNASVGGINNGLGYTAFHADGTLTTTQSNISGPYTLTFTFGGTTAGTGTVSLTGGGGSSLDFKSIIGALDGSYHAMSVTVDSTGNASWSMDSGTQTGTVNNFASASGSAVAFSLTNSSGGNDLHVSDDFTLTSTGGGGAGNVYSVTSASSLGALNLSTITGALQDVATHRANNGASQSRLGFAGELLTVNKANLEAANSRITDVDVAAESTSLARYNVLVQAGTAMLSQANQSAQMTLKLLS